MRTDEMFYRAETPEDVRLYDERSAVCRYYHITRRQEVLRAIEGIVARLPRHDVAVDLGCGSGVYTRMLPSAFRTRVGIDLAPHKLHFARAARGAASSVYTAASLLDIPLGSGSADMALCTEVLEHFPEPGAVLAEVSRILRPGARLVLSSPARVDLLALAGWAIGVTRVQSLNLKEPDVHGHYWYFTPNHLTALIEAAGFRIESLNAVPKVHFRGLPRLLRWHLVSDRFLSGINNALSARSRFATLGAFLIIQAERRG